MSHDFFQLKNERILLEIAPAFGARVTSLVDRRTGRNWLVPGLLEGAQSESAKFGAKEARGWDECFPTVGPCTSESWGKNLRDHGELWGRAWDFTRDQNSLITTYVAQEYRFQRRLDLENETVIACYKLENTSSVALPYLWSQHCLLNTQPGEQLVFNGIGDLATSAFSLDWPIDRQGQDQRIVLSEQAEFSQKAYAPVIDEARVGVQGENGSIYFTWKTEDAGYFGLWRDYGGWPPDNPVHQIALEPTTAPADDLARAKSLKRECWIHPGEIKYWTINVHLHS